MGTWDGIRPVAMSAVTNTPRAVCCHEATSMSAVSRLLLFLFTAADSSAKFLLGFLRLLGLSSREDLLRVAYRSV